jgi:hypothetical protein
MICTTRLNTYHSCKVWINCTKVEGPMYHKKRSLLVVALLFSCCVDGKTKIIKQLKHIFYSRVITNPEIMRVCMRVCWCVCACVCVWVSACVCPKWWPIHFDSSISLYATKYMLFFFSDWNYKRTAFKKKVLNIKRNVGHKSFTRKTWLPHNKIAILRQICKEHISCLFKCLSKYRNA